MVAYWRSRSLFAIAFILTVNGNYFQQYEELMGSEKARHATSVLQNDLAEADDKPKEIEIVCKENPEIFIKDIVPENSEALDECMILKIKGPQFSFQLSLSCEDSKRAQFYHNDNIKME